ncbi:hypothetical protein AX17_002514 [Amanita inopinata Kibby_2008]|nr:hypothetical protein AX17_002514 [Amanita inopinata Kibby_2008]
MSTSLRLNPYLDSMLKYPATLRQCRLGPHPLIPPSFISHRINYPRLYNTRSLAQESSPAHPLNGELIKNRYSKIFSALLVFGIAATAYGLHDIYGVMTMWPQAVRQDLRSALKTKYKNDLSSSEAYFQRAWSTAKSLPPSEFSPQPYLKTTGIAIALASTLEEMDKADQAYDVYVDALSHIQEAGTKTPLTIDEQLRGVALSCKLGEMAHILGRGEDQEERWLVWAVEVILKNVMVNEPRRSLKVKEGEHISTEQTGSSGTSHGIHSAPTDLELPAWVSVTDIAAPFEALGSVYARTDRDEYALPLFLQAVSLLIPPPPRTSSPGDRCRGAQTMSSISELIIRSDLSGEGFTQAEAWARKALDVTNDTKSKLEKKSKKWIGGTSEVEPACELALAVSLFNIGVLREMAGDTKEAKRMLKGSLRQSKAIGLEEGVAAAEEALKRLD